jgi:hypothetical protein
VGDLPNTATELAKRITAGGDARKINLESALFANEKYSFSLAPQPAKSAFRVPSVVLYAIQKM